MNKDILLIVPTRGRQDTIGSFIESVVSTTSITDICLVVDMDDKKYPHFDGIKYEAIPFDNIVNKINYVARKYIDDYQFFAFMGDDVRCRTSGWDKAFTLPLRDKIGISYGNDLLQGVNLPNNVVISKEIIEALGYMCPPTLNHFYIDNFWKDLGYAIGRLYYFESYILEHMHPLNKKSNLDDTYNTGWKNLEHDIKSYEKYKSNKFKFDVEKVRKLTL